MDREFRRLEREYLTGVRTDQETVSKIRGVYRQLQSPCSPAFLRRTILSGFEDHVNHSRWSHRTGYTELRKVFADLLSRMQTEEVSPAKLEFAQREFHYHQQVRAGYYLEHDINIEEFAVEGWPCFYIQLRIHDTFRAQFPLHTQLSSYPISWFQEQLTVTHQEWRRAAINLAESIHQMIRSYLEQCGYHQCSAIPLPPNFEQIYQNTPQIDSTAFEQVTGVVGYPPQLIRPSGRITLAQLLTLPDWHETLNSVELLADILIDFNQLQSSEFAHHDDLLDAYTVTPHTLRDWMRRMDFTRGYLLLLSVPFPIYRRYTLNSDAIHDEMHKWRYAEELDQPHLIAYFDIERQELAFIPLADAALYRQCDFIRLAIER